MTERTLGMPRRTPTEWFSTLPTLLLLLIVVFLSSGQIIHSQLLKIGEATWQEYFMLRSAGVMPEPTCNPDPNIDQRVREIVKQRQAEAAGDPLAGILGGASVDKSAIRGSLEATRDNCRAKLERYQTVQEKVTPAVIAFRNVEAASPWWCPRWASTSACCFACCC